MIVLNEKLQNTVKVDIEDKINLVKRYFIDSPNYEDDVSELIEAYDNGDLFKAEELLSQFPDEDDLLYSLLQKLENKSVSKTIRKIAAGKEENEFEVMKGYYSLCTHIAIECQQGNTEYKMLLHKLYYVIGDLIHAV